jgi:hypothetical protein
MSEMSEDLDALNREFYKALRGELPSINLFVRREDVWLWPIVVVEFLKEKAEEVYTHLSSGFSFGVYLNTFRLFLSSLHLLCDCDLELQCRNFWKERVFQPLVPLMQSPGPCAKEQDIRFISFYLYSSK